MKQNEINELKVLSSKNYLSREEANRMNSLSHEYHVEFGYPKGKRPKISKRKRNLVFEKYNGICVYCENSVSKDKFHVEHKQPLAKGGNNELANLAVSCQECNLRKGTKTFSEFFKDC
ncbi:HNH endonuclease [Fructobacillus sp. W13]|uniref:HNH endonuclease n=1 Tax=Fructobacillus apis TaxID=2935017 RepID=A0ABT0ZPQ8_9LACO|nr:MULTISPECIES: HNH endonuclease signature motif containing protein [Fructobacillus]MCK8618019.1 HNH endonuclease [Fructobacillus parabroussonetiae]MCO0831938.1 HNH endonuclease [Fructobacillus apis]